MDNLIYKFSYGLFVITAKCGKKDNGCIINTVMPVTENPNCITAVINKNSLTHNMIVETKEFNISVISEKVDFGLFKTFGFQSGYNIDKFSSYSNAIRSENGIYYITEGANSYLSAHVISQIDLGSHTMFIAEVKNSKILTDTASATYEYYQKNLKQHSQKPVSGYICKVCGYVYAGEKLPKDFICPVCKHGISAFEKIKSEVI